MRHCCIAVREQEPLASLGVVIVEFCHRQILFDGRECVAGSQRREVCLCSIALEDCYAANGSEMLRWLTEADVAVPDSTTLHTYARKYDVDEHAERFLDATKALLERDGLLPTEPVHLGFDITEIPWYLIAGWGTPRSWMSVTGTV